MVDKYIYFGEIQRIFIFIYKKGKSVPITGPRCPECSRKLRFPDCMTMAQDGGKVVSLTHRPLLPPREYSWYSFHISEYTYLYFILSFKNLVFKSLEMVSTTETCIIC